MTGHAWYHKKYPWFIGLAAAVLVLSGTMYLYFQQVNRAQDDQVADHIADLDKLFSSINEQCGIIGFTLSKDCIDYLTVAKFHGSTVGSMRLVKPENWQGPYLEKTLVADGREYQVLHTAQGYFIVPGNGVRLSNGAIIGKTLILDHQSDIEKLMEDSKGLRSGNRALAARIETAENPEAKETDDLIAEHIEKLSVIFAGINKQCGIIAFRHATDQIDFLTVGKFTGSVIGSMNLKNPEHWAGPYLDRDLTIHNRRYKLLVTNRGVFIVPPDGVELENGHIIGTTLVLNVGTDVEALIASGELRSSTMKPLAASIETLER